MNQMMESKIFNDWMYQHREEIPDYADRFKAFCEWVNENNVSVEGFYRIVIDDVNISDIKFKSHHRDDDHESYLNSLSSRVEKLVNEDAAVSFSNEYAYLSVNNAISAYWVALFMHEKFRIIIEPMD